MQNSIYKFVFINFYSLLFYFTNTVHAYYSNFWQTYIFQILTMFKQTQVVWLGIHLNYEQDHVTLKPY